jgi:pSer/pThr/pTyr-binding forkhead associated (FHA) protein
MSTIQPCSRCGRANDASAAFCQACGQALRPERLCPFCGVRLEASFRFCGHCGRQVADEAPTSSGPAATAADPAPAGDARRGLRLVPVRQDGLPGPVRALGAAPVACGRVRGELLFGDDPTVSPEHARFVVRGDRSFVEDLGSVNGTFLRLRAPQPLASGDEVRLGRQLLRVEPVPRPIEGAGARPWGSTDPGYRARLTQLLDGGGTGEVFPLRKGENTVGREAGQICFPADRYVSARHARVDVSDAGLVISDLGSSNGTFVRITAPAPVRPGDQVLVGMQLIRVE